MREKLVYQLFPERLTTVKMGFNGMTITLLIYTGLFIIDITVMIKFEFYLLVHELF